MRPWADGKECESKLLKNWHAQGRDAVKDAVNGLIITIAACCLTYALSYVDSIPLRRLISLEDSIFEAVAGKKATKRVSVHPIIFVDIDDQTLQDFSGPVSGFGETPRALVAQLIERIVKANASAIYIDLDMRSEDPHMADVLTEIEKAGATKVLVPSFLSGGLSSTCGGQSDTNAPYELRSPFDGLIAQGKVTAVHSIVMTGPYAFVEGTCSSYKVIRAGGGKTGELLAAMSEALRTGMDPRPMIPMTLFVGRKDELLRDGKDLIYAHVSARQIADGKVEDVFKRMTSFNEAIVVIGSSHRASGDEQPTPRGNVPGALIQANIGIGLNTLPEPVMLWYTQFGLDVFLAVLGTLVTILVYWYVRSEAKRKLFDFVFAAVVGVSAFMICVRVLSAGSGPLAAWRFGLLTCLSTAFILLAVSILEPLSLAPSRLGVAPRLSL